MEKSSKIQNHLPPYSQNPNPTSKLNPIPLNQLEDQVQLYLLHLSSIPNFPSTLSLKFNLWNSFSLNWTVGILLAGLPLFHDFALLVIIPNQASFLRQRIHWGFRTKKLRILLSLESVCWKGDDSHCSTPVSFRSHYFIY